MTDALHAEWTKLRTDATTRRLFLGAASLTVAAAAVVVATLHVAGPGNEDPTKLSLAGVDVGQTVVAILAILTISEEYATGMIRTTLAAIPQRLHVLGAKAANVAGLTLVIGLIAVPLSLLLGRLVLPRDGLNPSNGYQLVSLSHTATLRAAIGSILYLALIALLSLAIAAIIRNTAVSIGATLALLYILPIAAELIADPAWRRRLQQVAPMSAGLAIQATTDLHTLPISPWAGLGVLAAWTAAALILAGATLHTRDA